MNWSEYNASLNDRVMRMRASGLSRENVLSEFGCFGHFNRAHCFQKGFIGKCPLERLCRKLTARQDRARRKHFNLSSSTLRRLRGGVSLD